MKRGAAKGRWIVAVALLAAVLVLLELALRARVWLDRRQDQGVEQPSAPDPGSGLLQQKRKLEGTTPRPTPTFSPRRDDRLE